MARRLIPSLNRVLIEKIIPPSKTSSGIFLPETTNKLYSFLTKTLPLGLKGPCSTKAPAPTDEQPGPARYQKHQV
ncbi:hypothetical protein RJ639_039081 [Escallonia herrerae]|uniref:Uncharacterized protein n=1 Tax=Escallonia herrerae TaxID=1293975 RepID=A0AA89B3Y0_9ASTE|nr:hypothetical protein RJ639_039081 [Escallonia herrerae]